jgi:heptosyltransferase-2
VVDDRSVKHEVQRNLGLLSVLGTDISELDHALEVWLSDEDKTVAKEILASWSSKPLIGFALGAGSAKRTWPVDRFADVGRWFTDRGYRLVVVGGPGEEGFGEELRRRLRGAVLDLTNKLTLRQAAAVLGHCSMFCGNDAGPMHLAAAVGVPVVEISCHSRRGDDLHPNSPKRFGPWGVPHQIVRPEEPKDGCTAGCGIRAPHCILNVGVDSVIAAIQSLMNETAVLGGSVDAC